MKRKLVLSILVLGLFLLPLAVGAEDGDGALLLAEGDNGGEGDLSFTDISMIIMIIFVVIYFAAIFIKEWKQVR